MKWLILLAVLITPSAYTDTISHQRNGIIQFNCMNDNAHCYCKSYAKGWDCYCKRLP